MKRWIIKIAMLTAITYLGVSCDQEKMESTNPESFLQQDASQQLVSVKDVSNEESTLQMVEIFKNGKEIVQNLSRVGCTLDNDIQCGSETAAEIEEYVNQSGCITFNMGSLIFPIQANQYTYNYSYYVDSDDDINLDQYQFQFDSHVADIANQIAPNKITFISADASNTCGTGRGFKVSTITYTVILGN